MAAGKRKENESFTAYRARLNESEQAIKQYLKGRMIWVSTGINGRGTYERKKHDELS